MIQVVLVPLFAVTVCIAVGALALAGPAPVVVVGAPAVPASGAYAGAVTLTFTLSPPRGDGIAAAVLEVRGPETPVRRHLVAGATRVRVVEPGEHVFDWQVTSSAGGTTTGTTVVRVAA